MSGACRRRAGHGRPPSTRQHENAQHEDRELFSQSAVEKHVSAILSKLGLSEEPAVDRRVSAVLTYLRDSALHRPDTGR